jgi:hypothetical protein
MDDYLSYSDLFARKMDRVTEAFKVSAHVLYPVKSCN